MSTYYDYYLGMKKEDGKIYPIGPYNKDGHLISIYSTSNHWDDLQKECWDLSESMASEELYNRFKAGGFFDDEDHLFMKYIPLRDVYARAKDDGLKFGYVPTKLITHQEAYKANSYDNESVVDELNLEAISPIEYAALSEKNREKYAYYAWLDTESIAYEAGRIGAMAAELLYQLTGSDNENNIVVLVNIC